MWIFVPISSVQNTTPRLFPHHGKPAVLALLQLQLLVLRAVRKAKRIEGAYEISTTGCQVKILERSWQRSTAKSFDADLLIPCKADQTSFESNGFAPPG